MRVVVMELEHTKCMFDKIEDVLEDVKTDIEEMSGASNLVISVKEMTKEEFDGLPEFGGW